MIIGQDFIKLKKNEFYNKFESPCSFSAKFLLTIFVIFEGCWSGYCLVKQCKVMKRILYTIYKMKFSFVFNIQVGWGPRNAKLEIKLKFWQNVNIVHSSVP